MLRAALCRKSQSTAILPLQERSLRSVWCTSGAALLPYITLCHNHPLLIARILQLIFSGMKRDPLLAGFCLKDVEGYKLEIKQLLPS